MFLFHAGNTGQDCLKTEIPEQGAETRSLPTGAIKNGCHENAMKDAHTTYISLGSNLKSRWGQPEANLDKALEMLDARKECCLDAVSSLYLTEPQNLRDQPWFANRVARLSCCPDVTALTLLRILQEIEVEMGRCRDHTSLRFGPRIIDLDLLLFDQERWTAPDLLLPHPRLAERAFVLLPLCELDPELSIPGLDRGDDTPKTLLARLSYRLEENRIYQ